MAGIMVMSDDMLCCPRCGTQLLRDRSFRCACCSRVWPEREGIPSFLGTDFYWGEISRPEMRTILEGIDRRGWEQVVHRELPRQYPNRYRYVFHPIRADWFYVGGVRQRRAALDLGAGWGGLSLQLSKLFHEVVAVEAVWERIKFASMLFDHERAANVRAIHADVHDLPLPPESFDLVAMNGVLEWAALTGEAADPETAQRNLLAKALSLLRPGGSLYIGIENRFALIFLLGGRDHGRPRWMGMLPRPLARWYGKLSGVPERHPLTHSAAGYRRLLEEAGFEGIRFHTAFPSYSYPRALIPFSNPSMLPWAARKSSDWRIDSLSFYSKLAHRLVSSRLVARAAYPRAESFAIWAHRPERAVPEANARPRLNATGGTPAPGSSRASSGDREPLVDQVVKRVKAKWDEFGLRLPLPSRISALQLSGNWEAGGRVTWFLFANEAREPMLVARASRTASEGGRVANEHDALVRLQGMGDEVSTHVPRPLALWKNSNHWISLQEYVPGRAVFRVGAKKLAPMSVERVLRRCAPFLAGLACETRRDVRPADEHPYLSPLLHRASRVAESPDCSPEAKALLDRLLLIARGTDGIGLPVVAHHGDLNVFDILAFKQRFWVTDWEWFALDGLPFLDLVALATAAAERVAQRDNGVLPATILALVGANGRAPEGVYRSVQEIADAYCAALELSDEMRLPLAAATLLHCFVKERDGVYEGKRYVDPPDSNPWVTAARALMKATSPGGSEKLP